MQLIILFFVSLNILPASFLNIENGNGSEEEKNVTIKIENEDQIDFDFSITHEQRRNIIKVRSAQAIKSLRTVDQKTNTHKGYNVEGSEMIILPLKDFGFGTHIAEFKFLNDETVVLAKFYITEDALVLE